MKRSELKDIIRECIEELNEGKKPKKKYTKQQLAKAYKQIGQFVTLAHKLGNVNFDMDTMAILDDVMMSDFPISEKELDTLFDIVGSLHRYDHKSNNLQYFVSAGIGADIGPNGPMEAGYYDD